MEQMRIVKEMRERDRRVGRTDSDVFPRYLVWENVPGAFSSNKGEDFRTVLEEMARVRDPAADIPRYEGGRWPNAGAIIGNGYSIAWRTHDAQFWGVAQRRRRICVLADFDGDTAPEIVFDLIRGEAGEAGAEPSVGHSGAGSGPEVLSFAEGMPGDSEPGGAAGEGAAGAAGEGAENAVWGFPLGFRPENVRVYRETATTICNGTRPGFTAGACECLNPWDNQSGRIYDEDGVFPALQAREKSGLNRQGVLAFLSSAGPKAYGMGIMEEGCPTLTKAPGRNIPAVFDARGNGDGETVPTITGDHGNRVTDYTAICIGNGQTNNVAMTEVSNTLDTMHDQQAIMTGGPLQTVRRLTPLECERLQAFPAGWTDIGEWRDENGRVRKTSDAARYRALGNSMALPFWYWLLRRISAHCEEKTMGSLFDGIGAFPLCWQMINGDGSCRWASEIESFCAAVTKKHFGDDDAGTAGDWMNYVYDKGSEKKA